MNISRRGFLGSLGAAALGCSGAKEPPLNVLFIASDDLTSSTLGCYGHPLVKSPNIDSLAARGVRFDNAYCQVPFCGPSRASLMTGLRPNTTGITTNGNVDFRATRPDTVTLPQMFKNNGYRSMRVGKLFHMGVPGGVGSMDHQDPPSWDISISPPGNEDKSEGEGGDPTPDYRNGLKMQWVRTADASGQADSASSDTAIELLEQTGGDPFFLGLGFVRPHVPFVAPGEFFDLYPLEDIELAANPADDLDDIPAPAKNLRSFLWNHMGMSEEDQRVSLRGYYASTSFMDQQVGRVLDTVDRLGMAERTVVVFFGDHGCHLGEHTHWQKMSVMEEADRRPARSPHAPRSYSRDERRKLPSDPEQEEAGSLFGLTHRPLARFSWDGLHYAWAALKGDRRLRSSRPTKTATPSPTGLLLPRRSGPNLLRP